MAVLSDADRLQLSADFQRAASAARESLPCTRPNIQAAVNAMDDFFNANAAALNSAIPQPARGALTARQKTFIAAYVLLKRAGVL